MACWFKTANVTSASVRVLMCMSDIVGTGYFLIDLSTAGVPRALKQNAVGTTAGANTGVTLTANKWTFMAGLFETNTSRYAYSDGTLGAQSATDITDPAPDNTQIGVRRRSSGVDLPFDGSAALWTIWSAVLSQGELDGLNAGMHPARVRPKSIVRAWWAPTAGSRLTGFAGGAANLSLTGSVTDDAEGPPVEPYIYGLGWPSNAPLIEEAAATGWGPLLSGARNRLVA